MSTLPTLDPGVKKTTQIILDSDNDSHRKPNQNPTLPSINLNGNHPPPTFQPKAITPRGYLQNPIMPPPQKKHLMAPRSARQYLTRVSGAMQPSNQNIDLQNPGLPHKPAMMPLSHRPPPPIQPGMSKMPKKRLTNIVLPPLESNENIQNSNESDSSSQSDDEIYTGDGNISDEDEEDMFNKEELSIQVGQPIISQPA